MVAGMAGTADTVADMVAGTAVVEGLEARLLIATVTRSQSDLGALYSCKGRCVWLHF